MTTVHEESKGSSKPGSKYEVNDKSSRIDEVSLTIMGGDGKGGVVYVT